MNRRALSGMPTAWEKGVAMNRYCAANSAAANRARTASGTHLRRLPFTILIVCRCPAQQLLVRDLGSQSPCQRKGIPAELHAIQASPVCTV